MSNLNSFISKFSSQQETSENKTNSLGVFLDQFSTMTESYFFYKDSAQPIELRFDVNEHQYYRVEELGNLIPVHGVTNTLHIIDKSYALVPWAVKKAAEKLLRTIPVSQAVDEFGSTLLAPITLEDFTKLVMEAKDSHREILTDAGDVGHLAHKSLEDSIQYAIDHTDGIVLELRNLPTDEKALSCAQAAFSWMAQHKVKWIKTEQKIYSREYEYAGTLDGVAYVSSCDDPSCCAEKFVNSYSLVDWKTSNAIRTEYTIQVSGAYAYAEHEEHGVNIDNCFILRLGKDNEEAGKFEPYRIPAREFPEAFQGFLACLNLVKIVDSIKERMSMQKKGVREIKKQQRAEAKEIAKMKAKVDKAAAKAKLKLDRAEERSRIKADAKAAREAAKNVKLQISQQTPEVAVVPEASPEVAQVGIPTFEREQFRVEGSSTAFGYEEAPVTKKTFVVPEEEES